mgnify:CR=1 FL=1
MGERFQIDDAYIPIPAAAADADPAATMRELFLRVAKLEQALEEQRLQAVANMREVLSALLSLTDDVASIVERWGVATNAQEVALVRSVVGLGRALHALLERQQVKAIETLGKPFDPATSRVVGSEPRSDVAEETVLREVKVGYRWPHGLLRHAEVIVSVRPEEAQGTMSEADENTPQPDSCKRQA